MKFLPVGAGGGGGGGGGLPILNNNQFLQGLTTAAVAARLIGVDPLDRVALDADGLGVYTPFQIQIGIEDSIIQNSTSCIVAASNLSNTIRIGTANSAGAGNAPGLNGFRARGTWTGLVAINSGDRTFSIFANGYNSAAFIAGCGIDFVAAENWSVGATGAYMTLEYTVPGTTGRVIGAYMNANGLFVVGPSRTTSPAWETSLGYFRARTADNTGYAGIDSAGYRVSGVTGKTGTFTTVDLKTITVTNGLITAIV